MEGRPTRKTKADGCDGELIHERGIDMVGKVYDKWKVITE
jgi:hypothetical protein